MGDEEPISASGLPMPGVPASSVGLSSAPRFWTKRRKVIAVTATVMVLISVCGCAGFAGITLQRVISAEAKTMGALRPFVNQGYPGYRIVDSTRSGYILQHQDQENLRLDVRFERAGQLTVWEGPPREILSGGWSTVETFFRHAEGMPADPRTKMNYDVEGFLDAYTPVQPGPNAVVSSVWLEGTDAGGVERFVVLVARRNRRGSYVENMWPDHKATFTRDPKSGEWTTTTFEPVEIANPN